VRAKHYDLTANLYYLIGFREQHYRHQAVSALELKKGDVVVELGCGTGLNFPLLQQQVGPEGKIIGVDLTDRMLERAGERVRRHGWSNVELVREDAAEYVFPASLRGILSTFALTLMPGYDRIIRNGRESLASGGRFAILDLKKPDNAPPWLTRLMVRLTAPFGASLDLAERHPWESLERHFSVNLYEEYFCGFVYLSVGAVGENET
jgi:demethylmenaquinone methyltransferase/2-methoxy-6-polyprenyl-1,4-benzoquinol methylase